MSALSFQHSPGGPPITDEALMLAARSGDVSAFDSLARRYSARLVAYCQHFTGSVATAEEAAQDTWVGLWSSRATYEATSRFVVLLFTAAKNRCRNAYRSKQRTKVAFGRPAGTDVDALEGVAPSGLESMIARERRIQVNDHLQQLSPPLREALVLRVVDELSYGDIAAILDIPEATARSRVHLAVQKLRQLARRGIS